ncbi:unnamed protein product [Caenorhabditis nigoni]
MFEFNRCHAILWRKFWFNFTADLWLLLELCVSKLEEFNLKISTGAASATARVKFRSLKLFQLCRIRIC